MTSIEFPILLHADTDERYSLAGVNETSIGRSPNATIPILDMRCSRNQCVITENADQYYLKNLSTSETTLINGEPVADQQLLVNGDVISFGNSEFTFLEHADELFRSETIISSPNPSPLDSNDTLPPEKPRDDATVMITDAKAEESLEFDGQVSLKDDVIIGRDDTRCDLVLQHPQVSRLHAQVTRRDSHVSILDLNSANGTFVNGQQIAGQRTLRSGDLIDIGPFSLSFVNDQLVPRSRAEHVELSCAGLSRRVPDSTGPNTMLTILDDVSLTIPPCEFVCILGPSGSGKSTLLNAISGRIPADDGSVTINGEDLYQNFEAIKHSIALVPQKDLLHDSLTVEAAISYTAMLRLPADTTKSEIRSAVLSTVDTVGLADRLQTPIRNLSGGQLKRASLANETVNRPGLLFLDEVTSGLDEQTDSEMMSLFRVIAESGKTVICITHSLAHVEETCHRIIILTEGGKLAYVGPPKDALAYFGISKLGEIYQKLATQPADYWQREFSENEDNASTVLSSSSGKNSEVSEDLQRRPWSDYWRQSVILFKRYLAIQKTDKANLLLMLVQCTFVSFLIVLLFGDISSQDVAARTESSTPILFLVTISTFWFGCNNAAREIIKERLMYIREKDVNLLPESYYVSKLSFLGIASLIQTLILFILVSAGTSVECNFTHFFLLGILSLSGVGMGLLISSAASTTDMAITAVPLILIPQIIFSGAIAEVSGFSEFLASFFVIVYWAYGGLVSALPEELSSNTPYESWSATTSGVMIILHLVVYITATVALLRMIKSQEEVYQRILKTISQHASRFRQKEDSQAENLPG